MTLCPDPATAFLQLALEEKYSYRFKWLGRPIIQLPQDIVQFQEIVISTRPSLIIETGIAHGGSLLLSASLLCLLDIMDGVDPQKSDRKVVGIDIDIRPQNLEEIDNHPLRFKIELINGSSIDRAVVEKVQCLASVSRSTLVALDSNHTHSHVLAELDAYAELVTVGSYCIVFDTIIEDLPIGSFPDRPWDVGNNPKTAVHEWLRSHSEFEIDRAIDSKLLVSVAPNGYLRRVT